MSGLREKNKAARRRQLQEQALLLVERHGPENVSVEAICEAASVSKRTFFNYFAFKEEVFALPPPPLTAGAKERFLNSEETLLQALTTLTCTQLQPVLERPQILRTLRQLARDDPLIQAMQLSSLSEFGGELTELIARRLENASALGHRAISGAVIAATIRALDAWVDKEATDLSSALRESLGSLALLCDPERSTSGRASA